jgi:hypothetical protein
MAAGGELTKNDVAWEKLFDRYRILEQVKTKGLCEITATQINEYREARLMTKFDHRINLPKLFKENGLAILPISRGSYAISHFDAYRGFEVYITSEALALNCAYASGIIADFLEDEELLPTVSGRMSSDIFSYRIRNTNSCQQMELSVTNSQVEIDGGYEGIRQLAIVEAKSFLSEDFLVRQLYYPYRLWSSRVTKQVTPVFLVYSNRIYQLYEYKFASRDDYNSLVLVKHKHYSLEPVSITLDDILSIMRSVQLIPEPELPFPQADSLERVINLCELLGQGDMTKEDVSLNYAFDPRQSDYYANAGRYLGLIAKPGSGNDGVYSLTSEGRNLLRLGYRDRQLLMVHCILRHRAFNEVLRLQLSYGKMPSRDDVVAVMKTCNLFGLEAESTFDRRASTIISWTNWVLSLRR